MVSAAAWSASNSKPSPSEIAECVAEVVECGEEVRSRRRGTVDDIDAAVVPVDAALSAVLPAAIVPTAAFWGPDGTG
jgi:hypothetical protein